jgi:8-oxo-dGTP pyrophosphatase MutT (NUDIX family)
MAKRGSQQVAALPWRRGENGIEVLLITTRTTRRWLFPKGWPMADKADHEAATQEAYEEAGVRGTVHPSPIGSYGALKVSESGKARHVTVTVYALQVDSELADWPERGQRDKRWASVLEAMDIVGERNLISVLLAFDKQVPSLTAQKVPVVDVKSLWQRVVDFFAQLRK